MKNDDKGVNKMKKATLTSLLSLMLGFFIVISLSTTSFAKKEELQEIEGNILCVDRDSDGNIIIDEKHTECNGVSVVVSSNGNIVCVDRDNDRNINVTEQCTACMF